MQWHLIFSHPIESYSHAIGMLSVVSTRHLAVAQQAPARHTLILVCCPLLLIGRPFDSPSGSPLTKWVFGLLTKVSCGFCLFKWPLMCHYLWIRDCFNSHLAVKNESTQPVRLFTVDPSILTCLVWEMLLICYWLLLNMENNATLSGNDSHISISHCCYEGAALHCCYFPIYSQI